MFKMLMQSRINSNVRKGDSARDRHDWPSAARKYRKALQLDPDNAPIWVQYGHALKESGKLDSALVAYFKAIERSPDDADAHLQLGHALKLSGDRAGAIASYEKSFALDPKSLHVRRELRALKVRLPSILLTDTAEPLDDGLDTLCFDISDLLGYFLNGRVPTGIQRVQINVVEHLIRKAPSGTHVRIVAFSNEGNSWSEIAHETFQELCSLVHASADNDDPIWQDYVRAVHDDIADSLPIRFPHGAILVNLGTSWWLQNYFLMIRNAKREYGIKYVPYVHDLIPIITPEHCIKELTQDFISWILGVFDHADGFLVNSNSTAKDLKFVGRILDYQVHNPDVVPLDGQFRSECQAPVKTSCKHLVCGPFVLFVSTIESRKNHAMCFEAWLDLIKRRGLANTPDLICVGNRGWMVDAALARLESSQLLRKKVKILSGITDAELNMLYANCLFTIYPSAYEGWGLPITESLSHGKVVVTGSNSSLPEAGGELAVYVDINNRSDFCNKVEMLIDDVDYRRSCEQAIAEKFKGREWSQIAESLCIAALGVKEGIGVASSAELNLGVYQPLNRNLETVIWPGMPSGERHRIGKGWNCPDDWGCWMSESEAELAFVFPTKLPEDDNLYLVIALQGLPDGSAVADFTIEISGVGASISGTIAPGSRQFRTITFSTENLAGTEVRIVIRTNGYCDLAMVTDGQDIRAATLGVCGFMMYLGSDIANRQRLVEAEMFRDPSLLISRPPDAGDYSKFRK